LLALLVLFFLGKSNIFQGNRSEAVINEQKFKLEVVSNDKERVRGLGGRNNICDSCGMLFQFPTPGKYSFWMKDMKFPLDIIWISGNKIIYIAKNVSPDYQGTINPPDLADKVLELNGGKCDKDGIKEGDIINF